MIDPRQIPGYGVDADPSRRPGIPRERRDGGREDGPRLAQQRSDLPIFLNERPYKTVPPVFGTAQPPTGLAGRMRRVAYGFPGNWTRHWMLLLLADRVDVWEHRLRRPGGIAALAALALAGGLAVSLRRRSARTELVPR